MNAAEQDPGPQATLRQDAQRQLKAGTAPTMRGWGISVETLALLHRLASSPEGAADALKLLHELQVHQVELDLQHAQLEANERELDQRLARYRAMYELAPFAYFVLSTDGTVLEVNLAGASLLGLAREEIAGHPMTRFLAPESHARLSGLLQQALGEGAGRVEGELLAASTLADADRWRVTASMAPSGDAVLLSMAASDRALAG